MGTSGVIGRYRPSGCLSFYSYQKQMSELSETSVVYRSKTCSLKADEELESQLNLYALEQFDEAVSSISEVENLLSQTMQKLPERCREIFCSVA